jgi:hypothetical protein
MKSQSESVDTIVAVAKPAGLVTGSKSSVSSSSRKETELENAVEGDSFMDIPEHGADLSSTTRQLVVPVAQPAGVVIGTSSSSGSNINQTETKIQKSSQVVPNSKVAFLCYKRCLMR